MKKYRKEYLEDLTKEQLIGVGNELKIEDPEFLTNARLINEILNISSEYKNSEEVIIEENEKKSIDINGERKKETEETIEYDFHQLEEFYKKNINLKEDEDLEPPREIILYKNLRINEKDNFKIFFNSNKKFSNLVILKNSEGFCGYLNLQGNLLVGEAKNIDFERLEMNSFVDMILFSENDKEILKKIDFSKKIEGFIASGCPVEIKELEKSKKWLSLDFGTSNTSIGTYNDSGEAEIVTFLDITNNKKYSEVIPTIVWVESCKDKDNIEYLFGYEAKDQIEKSDYSFKNSVFYEIKKWICNDIEAIETINDKEGRKAKVKREEIIKAYLVHVIRKAEEHFKEKFELLHMSAPVKLKSKYILSYTKILNGEFKIRNNENSLDEGIAIIFNHIKNIMKEFSLNETENQRYPEKKDMEKVIIIDAGGGTTDLASCEFNFEKSPKGLKLNIKTNFEDGDSNFGGNNITYRILQYIKIKLANYYDKEENNGDSKIISDIESLFPNHTDILDEVERKFGVEELYKKMENNYVEAGKIIPTDYEINEKFTGRRQTETLKRNYQILWEAADIVKKEFFKRTDLLMIDFKTEDENNKKIRIPKLENLNLSIVQEKILVQKNELPNLSISINEIETLIYGEIYNLLMKLFFEKEKTLNEYDSFRLSGQTCKISLFSELLKEFIPGKKLRSSLFDNEKQKDSLELKLQCLKGSIYFTFANARGILGSQKIKNEIPILKYKVISNRENMKEVLSKEKLSIEEYSKFIAGEAKFTIYDQHNKFIKNENYIFISPNESGNIEEKETLDQILSRVPDSQENDMRTQLEGAGVSSRVIIVVPTEDRFAFEVLDIIKNQDKEFTLKNIKQYNFEKSLEESTFFNGRR
ncbi:MAG: hypothetical protein ACRC0R_04790 [Cetobacterium sp.]